MPLVGGIVGGLSRGRGQSLVEISAEIVGPHRGHLSSCDRGRAGAPYRLLPVIDRTNAAYAAEPPLGRGGSDGLGLAAAGRKAPAQALEKPGGGLCACRCIGRGSLRHAWRRLDLGARGLVLRLIGAPRWQQGRPL